MESAVEIPLGSVVRKNGVERLDAGDAVRPFRSEMTAVVFETFRRCRIIGKQYESMPCPVDISAVTAVLHDDIAAGQLRLVCYFREAVACQIGFFAGNHETACGLILQPEVPQSPGNQTVAADRAVGAGRR